MLLAELAGNQLSLSSESDQSKDCFRFRDRVCRKKNLHVEATKIPKLNDGAPGSAEEQDSPFNMCVIDLP